ncbi:Receptor-type tyrosine-protein phosphatase delta [Geodia barretti]|uniref:protein-tyrosine-phosphatase n=2 Tax=Geodia barretti TaxID=519541 RepID=A0AA35SA14_GEOBA|nr:Receptor-type tyrosine-protein phosphatase delta [Geodia barretti]
MADSPPISLTVLEVPDVVKNFTSGLIGARWAALEWTFGFDGNSDIISLRVLVTQEDETNMIEINQDVNRYNVTEGILPFTSYDFQVSVCNAIGCGVFTDTVTVTTEEDAPDAAPTITTSVSPSSTSLLVSWDPPVADKRNGILRDYIVYYTSDAELPMSMWERTSTPDNGITLTRLRIFTLYTVSVAASTTAGVGPYDTVEFRTLNDTCSEPFAVMSTDIGETTISLTWSESATPNGIVDSYLVSYGIEGTDDGDTVISEREAAVQLVNLKPFTQYTVTVTCVNGAGRGNSSSPLTRTTNSAPPTLPDDAISQVSQQPGGRQFSVVFNKPDETNGPISHYHAVAVLVSQDSASDGSLGDPDTDFNSFDSIDSVYSPACEKVSQTTAYIAAEFGSDEFQGSTLEFTFGKEEDTVNDRERYTNGPLCYSTSYGFFLRVYNDVSDNNVRRSVRQTASDRQYNRFSSSGYVTYNTESAPSGGSSSSNSGAIAGAVVVVIILLFAGVIVAIVIVFVIKKKRVTVYKTHTEAVDFDTSFYQNEHVELTDYRSPEEGGGREPIEVGQLASHVEQLHLNENCMFGEEYKVLQETSPKHPVEACIHSDNKQMNRYANIQCFDHSRCVLKPVEGQEHDYINANFIDGYNRRQEYIATQGPLPNTVEDFWRLVWDYNVFSIVMLTNLTEKMKVKCSQYWPSADSQTYAGITVTFKTITNNADFVVRTFDVKRVDSEEVRQIHQFHYVSWPDFGVPRHATPVLHFLRRIRDIHHYNNSQPMLIHCSAGVGRTGSLIAIDVELQRAQKEGVVDPFNYVIKMRDQRNLMIQTEAQYIFLYDAILEGTTSRGTEIPVEGLSSRMKELELMDGEGETGYRVEFNRLRQFRVNIKEFTDANDNANQFKNRLANALPYNDNRVYLTTQLGVCGSDYINASFIDGYTRKGTFIATQGPLPQTINDFWRMVAEKDVHVIVMLTQLEEKGKEMCACYWPKEVSGTETRGSLSTELLSEEPFQDFTHRKIKLDQTVKGSLVSRVVHHFQFTAWPENGAPEEGAGMIDLIGQVLRVQQQTGEKPIIVHCSAGIGRTGAFCALSIAIERVKEEGLIDVFHTVKHLRTQRPHMVQTPEQYIFCYRAISEYVSSLDQYSNFV